MIQETSKHAYHYQVQPTLGQRQEKVYETINLRVNMTNSEIAAMLDWPINTVTPRTNELVKHGLVVEDCRRICKVTGRKAIAWKVLRETLF